MPNQSAQSQPNGKRDYAAIWSVDASCLNERFRNRIMNSIRSGIATDFNYATVWADHFETLKNATASNPLTAGGGSLMIT